MVERVYACGIVALVEDLLAFRDWSYDVRPCVPVRKVKRLIPKHAVTGLVQVADVIPAPEKGRGLNTKEESTEWREEVRKLAPLRSNWVCRPLDILDPRFGCVRELCHFWDSLGDLHKRKPRPGQKVRPWLRDGATNPTRAGRFSFVLRIRAGSNRRHENGRPD